MFPLEISIGNIRNKEFPLKISIENIGNIGNKGSFGVGPRALLVLEVGLSVVRYFVPVQ